MVVSSTRSRKALFSPDCCDPDGVEAHAESRATRTGADSAARVGDVMPGSLDGDASTRKREDAAFPAVGRYASPPRSHRPCAV